MVSILSWKKTGFGDYLPSNPDASDISILRNVQGGDVVPFTLYINGRIVLRGLLRDCKARAQVNYSERKKG